MAFGPPDAKSFFQECLPDEIGLIEAWHPNFGDCLVAAIAQLLERGHRSAVVLNSDSPTLPTSLLAETAAMLALPGDRAVLGLAHDGGYYLLGLKSTHHYLFQEIAWSTEHVAQQTLDRAAELGLSVHTLPTWYASMTSLVEDPAGRTVQVRFVRAGPPSQSPPPYPRADGIPLANPDFKDRLSFNAFRRAAE